LKQGDFMPCSSLCSLVFLLKQDTFMHAWLCENPIGIDAVTWKELPTPVPAEGQVLIQIKAASLNFPDILIVQNKYPPCPSYPARNTRV
jgi:NADPH2:quinone reductase